MTQKYWQYFWRRTTKTRLFDHEKGSVAKETIDFLASATESYTLKPPSDADGLNSVSTPPWLLKTTHWKPPVKSHPLKTSKNQFTITCGHRHIISKQLMSTMCEGLMHRNRRSIKQEVDWIWSRVRTDQIWQQLQEVQLSQTYPYCRVAVSYKLNKEEAD